MRSLTIIWTALAPSDIAPIEHALREHDATLMHADLTVLAGRALPALATGAVVVICAGNHEASQALSSGADEVLRSGEVTTEALASAIERAFARTDARLRLRPERNRDAAASLDSALLDELLDPLVRAEHEWEQILTSLPRVLEVGGDLVAWSSSSSRDTPRRLAARRLAVASAEDLEGSMGRVGQALRRARTIAEEIAQLARRDAGHTTIGPIVQELATYFRGRLTGIDIVGANEGPCACAWSRASIVAVLSALVAHAADSIRATGRADGVIGIHAFTAEQTAIIEVTDNGCAVQADLRHESMQPYFASDPSTMRSALARLRDRVRTMGGDLIVDTGPSGTNVRVFLPIEDEEMATSFEEPAPGSIKPKAH